MNQADLRRIATEIGWKPGTPLSEEQRAKLGLAIEFDDLLEKEAAPKLWDEFDNL